LPANRVSVAKKVKGEKSANAALADAAEIIQRCVISIMVSQWFSSPREKKKHKQKKINMQSSTIALIVLFVFATTALSLATFSLTRKSKDGKDGANGKDGKDGKDGVDGKDAPEARFTLNSNRIEPWLVLSKQSDDTYELMQVLDGATSSIVLPKSVVGPLTVTAPDLIKTWSIQLHADCKPVDPVSDGTNTYFVLPSCTLQGNYTSSNRIIRVVNATREIDPDWTLEGAAAIYALALDSQGRLYIGGDLTGLGSLSTVGRTTASAGKPTTTLDATFAPTLLGSPAVVRALHLRDSNLFVAGSFTGVQPLDNAYMGKLTSAMEATSSAWKFNVTTGQSVRKVRYDAVNNQLYVIGALGTIKGQTRSQVARINADGTLDSFSIYAYGTIEDIVVTGNWVWACSVSGNYFYTAYDNYVQHFRYNLARFNRITGQFEDVIYADGDAATTITLKYDVTNDRLYVGMSKHPDVVQAHGVYRINGASTGSPTRDFSWGPKITGLSSVVVRDFELDITNGYLYAVGLFNRANDFIRFGVCRVPLSGSGTISEGEWNANAAWTGAGFRGVLLSTDKTVLYVCGEFLQLGGLPASNLAALNASTAQLVTGFAPVLDNYVASMAWHSDGVSLNIVGPFTTVNGVYQPYFARISSVDGSLVANCPKWYAAPLTSIATDASFNIFLGGNVPTNFTRNNMVKMGLSGEVDVSQNVNANGTVNAITSDDNHLYVAGDFKTIQGSNAPYLARLSLSGGLLDTNWVLTEALSGLGLTQVRVMGDYVYFAGSLDHDDFRGAARCLKASPLTVDTSWVPNVSMETNPGSVSSCVISSSTLALGGTFDSVESACLGLAFYDISGSGPVLLTCGLHNQSGFDSTPEVTAVVPLGTNLWLVAVKASVSGTTLRSLLLLRTDTKWLPAPSESMATTSITPALPTQYTLERSTPTEWQVSENESFLLNALRK
jgi:hypothetical protein